LIDPVRAVSTKYFSGLNSNRITILILRTVRSNLSVCKKALMKAASN
jgi:hypothetical protein